MTRSLLVCAPNPLQYGSSTKPSRAPPFPLRRRQTFSILLFGGPCTCRTYRTKCASGVGSNHNPFLHDCKPGSQSVRPIKLFCAETRNKFSLRPLFRKAYPIWADPAFWGEFCDPFLAGVSCFVEAFAVCPSPLFCGRTVVHFRLPIVLLQLCEC